MWRMKKPWSFTFVCPARFHRVILSIEYFNENVLLVSLFWELPSSGNFSRNTNLAVDRKYISYNCLCRMVDTVFCRSQWSRGLRLRSTAARLLRLWVRIPRVAWVSVCCECCVLSGRDHATHWSRVQRSSTDCDASLCVIQKPQEWGGHGPRCAAAPQKKDCLRIECWLRTSNSDVHKVKFWFSVSSVL